MEEAVAQQKVASRPSIDPQCLEFRGSGLEERSVVSEESATGLRSHPVLPTVAAYS